MASSDGSRIAFEVHGDGVPLVSVMGAICHRGFRPVRQGAKEMGRIARVISYDRRGRGDSESAGAWSVDRELDDIAALIDAVGGRAYLYGHSSGGVLALRAAHRFPDKVMGALVYDASWVADEAGAQDYAVLREEIEHLLDEGQDTSAVKRFLLGIGMPAHFARLLPLMPGWRKIVALAPTLRYDIALTANPPPLETLAEITVPVQVMAGGRSPTSLHRVAEALAAAIPGATLEFLPGHDHMVSEKHLLPSLDRLIHAGQAGADAAQRT